MDTVDSPSFNVNEVDEVSIGVAPHSESVKLKLQNNKQSVKVGSPLGEPIPAPSLENNKLSVKLDSPLGEPILAPSQDGNGSVITQPNFSFCPGRPSELGTSQKNRLKKVLARLRRGWGCPDEALDPIRAILTARFQNNNKENKPLVINDLLTCKGRSDSYWNGVGHLTFSAGAEDRSDATVWTPDPSNVSTALAQLGWEDKWALLVPISALSKPYFKMRRGCFKYPLQFVFLKGKHLPFVNGKTVNGLVDPSTLVWVTHAAHALRLPVQELYFDSNSEKFTAHAHSVPLADWQSFVNDRQEAFQQHVRNLAVRPETISSKIRSQPTTRVVSHNANSLRKRIDMGDFWALVDSLSASVLSIQETKAGWNTLTSGKYTEFIATMRRKGYSSIQFHESSKGNFGYGYSGTAVFSKLRPLRTVLGFEYIGAPSDREGRVIYHHLF
jgi:hypothetical protein